jgi:hypothetical protein
MKNTPKKEIKSLSVDKKIDRLESAITKLIVTNNKRFDSIDSTLNAHSNRFESFENRFESFENRFESFENRFETLENSIDELAQMTAKGFSDVDKRFDDVDKRFNEFKAETGENFITVRRDILSTNDRFVMQDTYFKKISLIESRLDNHDERITKIMNKAGKNIK